MEKIDFKKVLRELYSPPKKPVIVDVPEMKFLMIDGMGPPENKLYQQSIEALYGISFPIKFKLKKGGIIDYTVMPLEGLWWIEGEKEFDMTQRENWCWTSMIMQPEQVTAELVRRTIQEVSEKKDLPALERMRFESFHEGLSAQIMHIGPYSAEEPTIKKLKEFIQSAGYSPRGRHHEIYLSDPRRCAPERLKTVIRQPIE